MISCLVFRLLSKSYLQFSNQWQKLSTFCFCWNPKVKSYIFKISAKFRFAFDNVLSKLFKNNIKSSFKFINVLNYYCASHSITDSDTWTLSAIFGLFIELLCYSLYISFVVSFKVPKLLKLSVYHIHKNGTKGLGLLSDSNGSL